MCCWFFVIVGLLFVLVMIWLVKILISVDLFMLGIFVIIVLIVLGWFFLYE